MFEVDIPDVMPPALFDERLADGWFRSGPLLFRGDMLCLEEEIRGLVHIRLPLDRETPSRSRRRLLRRNRERFRLTTGPAQVDSERQRLYDVTKHRFMSFVARDLEPVIFGGDPDLFDTRELCVYDGKQLVAVSYFDVGHRSVVSQIALHDPEYARFSLGFYTMLEEIELARSCGAHFFYPGYVVPGIPAFEYKLRIGAVQYLEGNSRWRRRAQPPQQLRCVERLNQRLRALERALTTQNVSYQRRFYPGFWIGCIPDIDLQRGGYLSGLLHLRCSSPHGSDDFLVIEYLTEEDVFVLSRVRVDNEIDLLAEYEPMDSLAGDYEMRALIYDTQLCSTPSAREIALAARRETAQ